MAEKLFLTRMELILRCLIDDILAYIDGADDVGDTVSYMATVDHDISRMENLLDQWAADLKKNVMVLLKPCIFQLALNAK